MQDKKNNQESGIIVEAIPIITIEPVKTAVSAQPIVTAVSPYQPGQTAVNDIWIETAVYPASSSSTITLSQLIKIGACYHAAAQPGSLFEVEAQGHYQYSKYDEFKTGPIAAAFVAAFGFDALAARPVEAEMIFRLSRYIGRPLDEDVETINRLTNEGWGRDGVAEYLEANGL